MVQKQRYNARSGIFQNVYQRQMITKEWKSGLIVRFSTHPLYPRDPRSRPAPCSLSWTQPSGASCSLLVSKVFGAGKNIELKRITSNIGTSQSSRGKASPGLVKATVRGLNHTVLMWRFWQFQWLIFASEKEEWAVYQCRWTDLAGLFVGHGFMEKHLHMHFEIGKLFSQIWTRPWHLKACLIWYLKYKGQKVG